MNKCTVGKDLYFKLYPEYLPNVSNEFLKEMLDKLVADTVLVYNILIDNRNPLQAAAAGLAALSGARYQLVLYKIKLNPSFGKYYDKVKTDYLQETKQEGKPDKQKENQEQKAVQEDIAYQIKYNEMTSQITCNDFLLSKPQYDSTNERFFRTVYARPNCTINIADIDLQGKSVHKIIEQLGFVGDLKKIFFKANKNTVIFHNPIKISVLKDMKLYPIPLPKK